MSWSPTCRHRTTPRPQRWPRSSSAPGPTSCCSTSSTSTPTAEAVDLFRDELSRRVAERRRPDRVPVLVHRAGEHRRRSRDSTSTTTARSADPTTPSASASSPASTGMVVLSRFPIVTDEVRTFQQPAVGVDARRPAPRRPGNAGAGRLVHAPTSWRCCALSSKSYWDVPVDVDGRGDPPARVASDAAGVRRRRKTATGCATPTRSASGPTTSPATTPPGSSTMPATAGGLAADAEFVIVGDLNADPVDGDSVAGAIQQLLDLDRVQDPPPASEGAREAATTQAGANATQQGDPATRHRRPRRRPGAGQPPRRLRAALARPRDRRRRRVLAAGRRPAVDPRRSTLRPARITGSSGSTCANAALRRQVIAGSVRSCCGGSTVACGKRQRHRHSQVEPERRTATSRQRGQSPIALRCHRAEAPARDRKH